MQMEEKDRKQSQLFCCSVAATGFSIFHFFRLLIIINKLVLALQQCVRRDKIKQGGDIFLSAQMYKYLTVEKGFLSL